jgi:hypothetical protein
MIAAWLQNDHSAGKKAKTPSAVRFCMIPGPTVDEHHLTPRSQGGREKFQLHKVCHLKIHQALKPRELARQYNSWELLRGHPEVAKFIEWVKKRPPEFLG